MTVSSEALRVSVDESVAEPLRCSLDGVDGHAAAVTRDGDPFASFHPAPTTRQRIDSKRGFAHHNVVFLDGEASA